MDRRTLVIGALAATASGSPGTLLDRAIGKIGGAEALRRVRSLHWRGRASVFAQDKRVDIGVSTQVVPFTWARSDSWLWSKGPAKTRSLIITPDGGWVERDGHRSPMPAPMLEHERAQYAVYGLMLLVSLTDPGASGRSGARPNTLVARHRGAPDTVFGFDPDGRLSWATNSVPEADGRGVVPQQFTFAGHISDAGVRWPARLLIAQRGSPYFDLRIDTFRINDRHVQRHPWLSE